MARSIGTNNCFSQGWIIKAVSYTHLDVYKRQTLFFLFCEGAFDSVSVIIRSTIMQLLTPDQMRGRVSAVNSMFIGSSNEIGAFESGLTAKLMRTVPAVVFGGSMTLGIAFITYLKTKNLLPLTLNDIKPADKIEDQI